MPRPKKEKAEKSLSLCITLPAKLVSQLDLIRGYESRSGQIRSILAAYLKTVELPKK